MPRLHELSDAIYMSLLSVALPAKTLWPQHASRNHCRSHASRKKCCVALVLKLSLNVYDEYPDPKNITIFARENTNCGTTFINIPG